MDKTSVENIAYFHISKRLKRRIGTQLICPFLSNKFELLKVAIRNSMDD